MLGDNKLSIRPKIISNLLGGEEPYNLGAIIIESYNVKTDSLGKHHLSSKILFLVSRVWMIHFLHNCTMGRNFCNRGPTEHCLRISKLHRLSRKTIY